MVKAVEGQVLTLKEALALEDNNGDAIKFKLEDDGTYSAPELKVKGTKDANGKELPGYVYTYSLQPEPIIVRVTVTKTMDSDEAIANSNVPVPEKEKEKAIKAVKEKQGNKKEKKEEPPNPAEIKKEQDKLQNKWIAEDKFKKVNK